MFRQRLFNINVTQKRLDLGKIIVDSDIQARAGLNENHIEEYTFSLQNGDQFPPAVVYLVDNENYYLVDGFHRFFAHRNAGRSDILCEIKYGTKRDAILHAVQSNATHGIRRTNADKRRAVEILLKDKEWARWSDRHIAKLCRVSQPFVSSIRKELTDNGYQFSATRIGTTGWEISTRNIGSTKKAKEMPASDSDKTASEKAPDDIKSLQNKIEHLEELLKKKNEKIMAYAKHIGQLEERLKALEEKNSLSIQVA